MSVQRCQQETTASEFVEWMAYLELSVNQFNPLHHYLAQIAMEVFYCFRKRPKQPDLKPFLMTFEAPKPKPKLTPEQEKETYLQRSMGFWGSLAAASRAKSKQKKKVKPNGRRA